MALVRAGARRMRGYVHRLQDIAYYAGEYALIGFVGSQGPRRLMRLVFRVPVGFYRVGLGAAVGHNVLVLETTGRKTGRPHLTAMRYEYDESADTYYVLSGWRGQTDWYRNVRGNNRVNVRVGRRRFTTHAELLGADESVAILACT